MATFVNKKERVFDIELTSYGRYLMSVGKFKPEYYAFYDDNIIYDKNYANASATENQNDIDERIKDTQYIGSLVLFRDVEKTSNNSEEGTARQQNPAKDIFKFDAPIGDAEIEGDTANAPAWKVVAVQTKIDSTTPTDPTNDSMIPQINITARYNKKIIDPTFTTRDSIRTSVSRTATFADGKQIILMSNDPMYYVEELNTPVYIRNFDIEVFEILESSNTDSYEKLSRKNIKSKKKQIVNGFMTTPTIDQELTEITSDDVEYYFDILSDSNIEQEVACKAAGYFNKKSYYVDLDFECEEAENTEIFYDIYGTLTEPEICLD